MDIGAVLILGFLGWMGWLYLRPSKPRTTSAPPALRGDGSFNLSVAGTQHYEGNLEAAFASVIRSGRAGREDDIDPTDDADEGEFETCEAAALLRLDDDNPHDKDAVQVLLGGALIGFLPAKLAPHFRAMIKKQRLPGGEFRCAAKVNVPLSRGQYWDVQLDLPRLKS